MTKFQNFKKFTIMEQSESTASDSTELETELFKKYVMFLNVGDGTSEIYASDAVLMMKEYASKKDAQIQALTKEVDELKERMDIIKQGNIEAAGNIMEMNEKCFELKEAGNKMAEALKSIKMLTTHKRADNIIQALESWENLNK